MSSFVAVRALRTAINNGNAPWRSLSSTSTSSKPSKSANKPTSGGGSSGVQIKNPDPPANVFKKSGTKAGKDLGPGASKDGSYQNPEYFQYHNMSYAEMEVVMEKMRVPQPSSKPKSR